MPLPPQTPTPVVDKTEKQSPPIALQDTPVQNNGATAPSAPEEKKTPVAVTANGAPPTSNTAREEDHISKQEWDNLLDACCKAGVSHLEIRQVIATAAGIPKGNVGVVPLTRAQYRRALRYLADCRNTCP
jgi:hypothetical protein